MADNVTANAGTGGATFASDDIGGVQFPRTKLVHGADGTNDGDVAQGNPLPAEIRTPAGDSAMDDSVDAVQVEAVGNLLTAIQLIDDIAHTINAALNKAAAIAGQLDDTAPVAATEGNVAPVRITAQRGLHANLRKNDGTELATATDPVRTDPTGTTAQPVTDNGGAISVDDNGASLTVDGSVDIGSALPAGTNLLGDVVVNDIEDGAGDSVMDAVNNAIRVNIIAGAGSGGTAMQDDTAFTPGTTQVTPLAGMADETAPDSVDEGDAGVVRMSTNRNLYTQLRDAAGNERGANINASNQLSVSVDNSPTLGANDGVDIGDVDVASVTPGTGATQLGKAEDATHTTGDVGVMALAVRTDSPANRAGGNGDYEPLQVASGRLWASATIDAALPAGTNNIGDVDIASLPNEGQQTMANSISVAVASDQAEIPAGVVNGQLFDDAGNALTVKTAFSRKSASGNNTFIAAVGGKKIRVLGYRLQAQGTVDIKFVDTAGTPADLSQIWSFQAREGVVVTAQAGAFEFESGTGLGVQVNLSAAINTDVSIHYVEV